MFYILIGIYVVQGVINLPKWKLTIDRDECIGDGICASLCDELFEMDDEGKAKVLQEIIEDEELAECAQDAADNCPVACIHLEKQE